jgi:hypothetical protein
VCVCVYVSRYITSLHCAGSVKRRLIEAGAGAILESVAAHYADNEAVLPTVTAARAELGV